MTKSRIIASVKGDSKSKQRKATLPVEATDGRTYLVGGNFDFAVKQTLGEIKAMPEHTRREMRDLLGEAINDFCEKYRKPRPYIEKAKSPGNIRRRRSTG